SGAWLLGSPIGGTKAAPPPPPVWETETPPPPPPVPLGAAAPAAAPRHNLAFEEVSPAMLQRRVANTLRPKARTNPDAEWHAAALPVAPATPIEPPVP